MLPLAGVLSGGLSEPDVVTAWEDKATCLAGAGKHVRSLEEVMVPALGTDGHFHYDDKGTWFAIFTYKDKPWVVHVDLSCWPSSVDPRK